jgi:anaerobic magnesium-protoporphyrin IX monomethyl ester cyclase
MKIALINPSVKGSLKKENLGLANLASTLEADGHTTRIIDEIAGQNTDGELDDFKPDLVGISFMTMYAPRAYALATKIKKERGLTVVLGGAHPTAMPEEALKYGDCVVKGEAEWSFPQAITDGKLEGIIDATPPPVLDELPIPSRWQLDMDTYASAGEEIAGFSYRTLGIITSRGCPFKCTYCINSERETKLRFHGPERVIEELKYVVDRHHIESVAFYDELMATDAKRFKLICESMIQNNLHHLKWECQMHAKTFRPDVLELMKKAGCIQVTVGFESGSQKILNTINKGATIEENDAAARMAHEAGLRVRGCFIVGTPGETREDVRMTEKFIKKAKIDFASVHYMTPMPGTALYNQFSERIEAENIGWDKFTCGNPDTINCNDAMDVEEQKMLFERLSARTALLNYTIPEMVKRSIENPHHAMHVAKKLFSTAFNS